MNKKMGVPLYPGVGKPSKAEGEGMDATFFSFKKTFIRHFEKKKIPATMMLNLQNILELPFSFCIGKKTGEILIFKTFIAKFWIFAYFSQKIAIFRSACFYDNITT